MNELNQKRIDSLTRIWQEGQWFGRKPFGCYPMEEAVKLLEQNPELVIATVAWWGELPAGFTWADLIDTTPENGHYHVRQQTEPRPRENFIPSDEPVAVYWRNQFAEN